MARRQLTPIDDTYNHTLPPYGNSTNKTIIFALVKYHIPSGSEESYEVLYNLLSEAVSERSQLKLQSALERLAPYKVRDIPKKQYKQTVVRSVKDFGKPL